MRFEELGFSVFKAEKNYSLKLIIIMLNPRKIDLSEIKLSFFIERDSLINQEARRSRLEKLRKATILCNREHQTIGIITTLFSGEVVTVHSDFIECTDDFVQLKEGVIIPMRAIVDVDY